MYPKSLVTTALVALQFTTGTNAFFFRNNLEIVHGGANIQPEHASSYYSVFAREDDPEPEFELVPMSVKDKIVSLKRRAIAGCEEEYTGMLNIWPILWHKHDINCHHVIDS